MLVPPRHLFKSLPRLKQALRVCERQFLPSRWFIGNSMHNCNELADFYNALKMKVPEERMHKIESLQIHSTAFRGKTAELTFDWLKGPADTKDELEGGMKQIIGGFYQTYWSLMATAPIPRARDISRIEPQPDGTTKLFEADANNKIEIDLDSKQTPTHYAFDTAAFKGTFDLQYVDSPKPSPGDLRRLSDSHIVANIGASDLQTPTHYAFDTAAFKGTFDLQYVDSPKPSPGDLRRLSDSHIVANIGA